MKHATCTVCDDRHPVISLTGCECGAPLCLHCQDDHLCPEWWATMSDLVRFCVVRPTVARYRRAAGVGLGCPAGHPPIVDDLGHGYTVACDCYDGAPDAGPQLIGWGRSRVEAIDDWNEQVADAIGECGCEVTL